MNPPTSDGMGVYSIRNLEDGAVYVGCTKQDLMPPDRALRTDWKEELRKESSSDE